MTFKKCLKKFATKLEMEKSPETLSQPDQITFSQNRLEMPKGRKHCSFSDICTCMDLIPLRF